MEFIRDGHVVGFERITSPINNNPNQTKTIRLIREHNPTLASRESEIDSLTPGTTPSSSHLISAAQPLDHSPIGGSRPVHIELVIIQGTSGQLYLLVAPSP